MARAARGRGRGLHAVLGATLLVSALAGSASGQSPKVVRLGMWSDLTDDAHTEVRLKYQLRLEPGTETIHVRAISFFGAELDGVRAHLGGSSHPVRLDRSVRSLQRAGIPVPVHLRGGAETELEITYRVSRNARLGDAFDIALPVLMVDGTPAGSPENFFAAEALIPAGYAIVESFPTVPRSVEVVGGDRRYALQLQVIPSLVRWRGQVGRAPLINFERVVDAVAVGTILLVGLLLMLRMRRA